MFIDMTGGEVGDSTVVSVWHVDISALRHRRLLSAGLLSTSTVSLRLFHVCQLLLPLLLPLPGNHVFNFADRHLASQRYLRQPHFTESRPNHPFGANLSVLLFSSPLFFHSVLSFSPPLRQEVATSAKSS